MKTLTIAKRWFASAARKPYSVLYFGSEDYARATLGALLEQNNLSALVRRLTVVVPPLVGTTSPTQSMHDLVNSKQLEKFIYRKKLKPIEEFIRQEIEKKECPFDIGIIGSFGRKIPAHMVDLFPQGMLVAHPSLLPKYRGPCPIQHCVMNGEKLTGATVLDISKEVIDGGDILLQRTCEIADDDNYLSMAQKCGWLAGEGLAAILDDLDAFRKKAVKQSNDSATIAYMISRERAMFDWGKLSAGEAVRMQKALYKSPTTPYSKFQVHGKWRSVFFEQLRAEDRGSEFYKENLEAVEGKAAPGTLHWGGLKKGLNRLCIRCKEGWVSTESIKLEGTPFIRAENFVRNNLKNLHYSKGAKFVYRLALPTEIPQVTTNNK
ncbi:MAG: formyltransferase family protein [Candidatus Pacebacteria bacterium]|nr:formyltransferase family protein [Candidatus Paceibacterota bacterium]